jgi:GTP-binding protein Era
MANRRPGAFVSGFVSILGRPNTGKSTLLNALVGEKVAIVSDKPQTTRTAVQGVLHLPDAQVVFMDTPGIHRPDTPLNRKMTKEVEAALEGRDLLLYVVDCTRTAGAEETQALELLRRADTSILLVLNKVDRLKDKSLLLPLIDSYSKMGRFEEFLPVSALSGEGLEALRTEIVRRLPEGPRYFPEDEITDQPERFLAAETIREKALWETRQEVPHALLVDIERWEEAGGLLRLSAVILVEKPGQKAILIGAKGAKLKAIGAGARVELEERLGRKIFLELFVKVRKNWREDPTYLAAIGWKGRGG